MAAEIREAGRHAKQRGQALAADPRLTWLARMGHAARGVVYTIVGILAALAALGQGGETTGAHGALRALIGEPLGKVLLIAVAIGMQASAIWGAVQAVADPDHRGHGLKGVILRIAAGAGAIAYSFMAFYAAGIALGWIYRQGGPNGDSDAGSVQSWSAWAISQPAGRLVVAAAGCIVFGVGVSQIVIGWIGAYRRWLAMDRRKMKWADPVCKFGLIARGVVFILIGIFVVAAAYQANPGRARGFGGALRSLQGEPYGAVLLMVVALGLVAFGVYSFILAIYRRVGPSENHNH